MANILSLTTRHFTTINKGFTITLSSQFYRGQRQNKLEVASKGQKIDRATDWLTGPIDLARQAIKLVPQVARSLPLIEEEDPDAFTGWACSTFILKDGRSFPQYLPEQETEQLLRQALARHDRLWLTDGEDMYCLPASAIAALIIA